MAEIWFENFKTYLAQAHNKDLTPKEWAQVLHEALELAEAEKYATAKSRFIFRFIGATEEELAEVRLYLTAFENRVVELTR